MLYDPVRYKNQVEDFDYDHYMDMFKKEQKYIGGSGVYAFYAVLDASLAGSRDRFLPILNSAIEWMHKGIEKMRKN